MGMHQGMDLSRFKKISSDGKSSTLRHPKGHEIKIAHTGLTDKMRDHIANMPVYLAEGGPVKEEEELLTDAPEVEAAAAESAMAPPVPPQGMPQQAPPQKPLQVGDITPSSYTPTPQPPQVQMAAMPIKAPQEDMDEHVKFATDIANGLIHPKTYSQLYGEQNTLGKIGTLFGLMLSGAGSGLTHQPNMVMEMMNKEIDRDFEKQKANKEGARNFLSIQYAHDLQEAQAASQNVHTQNEAIEGMGKAAGTANFLKGSGYQGTENILPEYIKQAHMSMTPYRAKAKAIVTAADFLDKKTMNNPQANAMVKNTVIPQATAFAGKLLDEGHAKAGEVLAKGQQASSQNRGRQFVVDEDKLSNAIRLGQSTPQGLAHPRGAINPQDVPTIQREKAEIANNRDGAYSWDDSFKKLAGANFAGQAPGVSAAVTGVGSLLGSLAGPWGAGVGGALAHTAGALTQDSFERERNIEKEALMNRLGSGLSDEAKQKLINSVLPTWNDTPESMARAHKKGVEHFRDLESKLSPTLDTYSNQIPGLKAPFPGLSFSAKKPEKKKGTK